VGFTTDSGNSYLPAYSVPEGEALGKFVSLTTTQVLSGK